MKTNYNIKHRAMATVLALIVAISCMFTLTVTSSAASVQFDDVSPKAWYAKAVDFVSSNGYMNGVSARKFDPTGKVSRAQMAQILYNFSKAPDITGQENPFTDVKSNAWYHDAVVFCKNTGIVNGTSSTTYSPNNYITREQVAVMLMGYAKSTGKNVTADTSVLNGYSDKNSVSSFATNAIAWAVKNGVMSGSGSKLNPKGTCIRAELAQFIMNYCQKIGTPGSIVLPPVDPVDPLPEVYGYDPATVKPIDITWLPEGGYWGNDGRKYNKYGIDITDVDGVPDDHEIWLMHLINEYRVSNSLPALKWNQHAQLLNEIRAREADWIIKNKLNELGSPHYRPNGSIIHREIDDNGTQHNELMIEELKCTNEIIDKTMTLSDMTIDKNQLTKRSTISENIASGAYNKDAYADAIGCFNGWKNSPAHNNAMIKDFTAEGTSIYFACAIVHDTNNTETVVYDAYALNWIKNDTNPDDDSDWYPGKGINYTNLGFTVNDIPTEYTDWIEREYKISPEEYGPTDHDENALNFWLKDQGISEDSNLFLQVKAHFYANMDMDNYIKYMISKTSALHYTFMYPGEMNALDEMWSTDISGIKKLLINDVADKLAWEHPAEINQSAATNGCGICLQNHSTKRDLATATKVVNQFFMNTYSFDISSY